MTTTLTAEAVRGMGAGRQLDALVAEHVMGWRERGLSYGGAES